MLIQFCAFDRNYLERLRRGDVPTQRHFADYFGRLIRLKLSRQVDSTSAIDDICQETFLRVWVALRKHDGIRQPERFGAFVSSVCSNVLREYRRRAIRDDPSDDDSVASLCDIPTSIVDILTVQDLRLRVARVLEGLPAKHRDLIRRVWLEEYDKDTLCRNLGVNRKYLRVLLHRATQQFRKRYLRELGAHAGCHSSKNILLFRKSLDQTSARSSGDVAPAKRGEIVSLRSHASSQRVVMHSTEPLP